LTSKTYNNTYFQREFKQQLKFLISLQTRLVEIISALLAQVSMWSNLMQELKMFKMLVIGHCILYTRTTSIVLLLYLINSKQGLVFYLKFQV